MFLDEYGTVLLEYGANFTYVSDFNTTAPNVIPFPETLLDSTSSHRIPTELRSIPYRIESRG